MRSALNSRQWRRVRALVEGGASFRELADRYGVAHSTIARRAAAEDWFVPKRIEAATVVPGSPRIGPPGPVSGAQGALGPTDPPPAPVAPPAPPGRPVVRPEVGPPDDERSARLWVCPRCKRVGFDPNRRERAWHTPATCEAWLRRLDAGFEEGGPGERPAWSMPW